MVAYLTDICSRVFTRVNKSNFVAAGVSDVLVENFLPGKLAEYGLDYESLNPTLPGLIYCSISGFGQTGPYRHRFVYT
jgi:crotonobetainyl-CoA:carnitine CoA-transferase CaiB-like acyl-CoA transferase